MQTPENLPRADPADPSADALRASLRDTLHAARHWQDLLTPADRQIMLDDIARVALAVGRDTYAESPAAPDLPTCPGDDPTDPASPREQVAFLAARWPQIERAVSVIAREPAPAVVARSVVVPVERARRVRAGDLRAAIGRGDWVPVSTSPPEIRPSPRLPLAVALGGWVPRRVAHQVMQGSWDTPAYRAVHAMLARYARDLAATVALAQVGDDPLLAAQAARLRNRVRAVLRQAPWQTMPPAPTVAPLPPGLRRHGSHRLLHDIWGQYKRAFALDWHSPVFHLPARQMWVLYEQWTLFAVADALRGLGFRASDANTFALTRSGLAVSLVKGVASRLDFARPGGPPVSLFYNRYFRRGDNHPAGWHSASFALRPDIVLVSNGNLLVLDAKFKTYTQPGLSGETAFSEGALLPDLQQMHTYRDALRYGDRANVVWGAWLLYTGRVAGGNPPAVAFPPATPQNPFGDGQQGAVCLRPGDAAGAARLAALVAQFLARPRCF